MDGCTGHSHDHDHEDERGICMYEFIDKEGTRCLNEVVNDSGKSVIKAFGDRFSADPFVQSPEDDPELLFQIPFTESLTLQSISIHNFATSAEDTSSPRTIKVFANRDDLDFETARELEPSQTLELVPDSHLSEAHGNDEGTIDYPFRPAGRFQNITSICIFVENNFDESGEAGTSISYIGLKGKGTGQKRKVVDAVYESRAMLKDHKVKDDAFGGTQQLF